MSTGRPVVSVFDPSTRNQVSGQVKLPAVFGAPLRHDIVNTVHDQLTNNTKQAHGINFYAGMKHSSLSWGTGRAVSRVPRIRGSGSHRTGQGANANFCRAGRMAFPLRNWRRWHRKVNLTQRRHALAAAIAASANTALVQARGHRVTSIPQLPLIFSDEINNIQSTKEAVRIFTEYGVIEDINRVISGRKLRAGRGKLRNRRWKMKRGPLVIGTDESQGFFRAVQNLPGVDTINVDRLNIRHLAPGGHLGRFCVWTQGAIQRLHLHFGGLTATAQLKSGYHIPRSVLSHADISQIINSNEVQESLIPAQPRTRRTRTTHKNPLRNRSLMDRLNPYARVLRQQGAEGPQARKRISKAERTTIRNRSRAQLKAAMVRVSNAIQKAGDEYRELAAETMI